MNVYCEDTGTDNRAELQECDGEANAAGPRATAVMGQRTALVADAVVVRPWALACS